MKHVLSKKDRPYKVAIKDKTGKVLDVTYIIAPNRTIATNRMRAEMSKHPSWNSFHIYASPKR